MNGPVCHGPETGRAESAKPDARRPTGSVMPLRAGPRHPWTACVNTACFGPVLRLLRLVGKTWRRILTTYSLLCPICPYVVVREQVGLRIALGQFRRQAGSSGRGKGGLLSEGGRLRLTVVTGRGDAATGPQTAGGPERVRKSQRIAARGLRRCVES